MTYEVRGQGRVRNSFRFKSSQYLALVLMLPLTLILSSCDAVVIGDGVVVASSHGIPQDSSDVSLSIVVVSKSEDEYSVGQDILNETQLIEKLDDIKLTDRANYNIIFNFHYRVPEKTTERLTQKLNVHKFSKIFFIHCIKKQC